MDGNRKNQRNIKVLYIDHAAAYPEEQNKYLALAKQEDLEICLLRPRRWADAARAENFEKNHFKFDFKVTQGDVVFKGFRHRSFFYNRIGGLIKNFQPDFIHLFEEANTFFTFQAYLMKRLFSPSTKLVFDNFQNILFEHTDYTFHQLYDYMESRVFKNSVCATVRYQGSRDFLLKRGFNKPIYEIPWGTDISLFRKMDSNSIRKKYQLDKFTFGYIGRLEETKGILDLINAFARLKEDARLLIVGKGSVEDKMNMLIKRLNLSDKIRYVGYVSHPQLPEYYNAMDCLVVPTYTTDMVKEQFGRVIIEALACGVPVVGSTSGAIPAVIGEAGLVFEEKNVQDLTEKMTKILVEKDLRSKLGRLAVNRVHEKFTWDKFAESCVRMYREMQEKQ